MNCARCGSELPQGGAYCPICGAPRNDLDRLIVDARNAAEKAVEASVVAFDRASKELQPAVERAVAVVEEVGKALKPLADTTVRAVNDVANSLRPAAQRTATAARQMAHRTAVVVGPAVAKAAEKTEAAARRVIEAARKLG